MDGGGGGQRNGGQRNGGQRNIPSEVKRRRSMTASALKSSSRSSKLDRAAYLTWAASCCMQMERAHATHTHKCQWVQQPATNAAVHAQRQQCTKQQTSNGNSAAAYLEKIPKGAVGVLCRLGNGIPHACQVGLPHFDHLVQGCLGAITKHKQQDGAALAGRWRKQLQIDLSTHAHDPAFYPTIHVLHVVPFPLCAAISTYLKDGLEQRFSSASLSTDVFRPHVDEHDISNR